MWADISERRWCLSPELLGHLLFRTRFVRVDVKTGKGLEVETTGFGALGYHEASQGHSPPPFVSICVASENQWPLLQALWSTGNSGSFQNTAVLRTSTMMPWAQPAKPNSALLISQHYQHSGAVHEQQRQRSKLNLAGKGGRSNVNLAGKRGSKRSPICLLLGQCGYTIDSLSFSSYFT